MITGEKQLARETIGGLLTEAQQRADANDYPGALTMVAKAKTLERRNVYILAFEKQLEQLIGLSSLNILTGDQRTDILESIPGIIDRALEESESPGASNGSQTRTEVFNRDEAEKRAALEWLKDQYFQHAHEHVKKEEYALALTELRRVYIIDPSNKTARDFERQIEQIAEMRGIASVQKTAPRAQAVRGVEPAPQQAQRTQAYQTPGDTDRKPQGAVAADEGVRYDAQPPVATIRSGSYEEQEPPLIMAEEWSSPGETSGEEVALKDEEPSEKREKPRTFLVVFVLLAIVALGTVLFLYWKQQRTLKKASPGLSSTISVQQDEGYIGAPAEAEEQNIVVPSNESRGAEAQSPKITDAEQPKDETPAEPKPAKKSEKTKAERKPAQPAAASTDQAKETTENSQVATRESNQGGSTSTQAADPSSGTSQSPEPGLGIEKKEDTSSPVPFIPVEKPPQIIKMESPEFSDLHFDAGTEGQVIVSVQINAQGKPVKTKVLKTSNSLLNPAVIDAVMRSQYAPAQMASGPVMAWLTIPFRFRFGQ